ncbi:MAG: hypothetical protein ABR586_03075 [Thermoplasmatota archaeon]
MAVPAFAAPPGNYSITFEYVTASYFDFKDGVGIADPADQNNPCTALLLGLRGIQPLAETWEVDQNMGTNLNGPGVGISNLVPPLAAVGGWLPASGGIDVGVDCPIPGSPVSTPGDDHSLWLVWSGVNWRSAQADSSTQISLCTQQTFASSSPGCLAIPTNNMLLIAAACANGGATFGHDYTDQKGKYLAGTPFDTLALKNDQIFCATRSSANYTNTVQDFTAGGASQTFDIIKNEAVVNNLSGSTYMAVCWRIDYIDFSNPLAPVNLQAQTHDWKLILDLGSPAGFQAALSLHYGGAQTGDVGTGPATVALRGFYSDDSTGAGQNGFGPCPLTGSGAPGGKKPSPLI